MENDGINIENIGTGSIKTQAQIDTENAEAKKIADAKVIADEEAKKLAAAAGAGGAGTPTTVELEGKKYTVDEKGNLLNEDKTVFKSKEDYDKLKAGSGTTPTVVNLDGKDYKLDDKGNALGEDGKIFKTKDELDTIEAEGVTLVEELQKKSGYIFKDDKGNPKVYEDTTEGLIAWTNDIATEKAKQLQTQFLEQNAEIKSYNDFLQKGGKPEEYFDRKASSWKDIKLDEKNEEQLIDVIKTDLMMGGMAEGQAELTVKMYKDTDKLKEFGKVAHKKIVDFEIARDKYEKEEFDLQQTQRIDNSKKYWDSINNIVTKGTLQNITIPENERADFFKFVSQDADGKGNTQAMINKAKATPEVLLAVEYLFFKGLDLNKLVTNAVKTDKVRTLRSRFGANQNGLNGGKGVNKDDYSKSNSTDGISLEVLQK